MVKYSQSWASIQRKQGELNAYARIIKLLKNLLTKEQQEFNREKEAK